MTAFLVRRLVDALPVVFLATVAIFPGLHLIPGDPALIVAGQDATPETLAAIRQANGLDQPLPVQYGIWLNNLVHGNLGASFFTRAPVATLLALTLALPGVAAISRLVKASMLEVLGDDFVRTARANGLAESGIIWRHALRNALVPVITVLGLQFGCLLGGDYAVVQACLLLLVLVFIGINLLPDIIYGVLDPRIRLTGGRSR